MSQQPTWDEQVVHRHFAAACFNRAWDLIDKTDRSPEEDRELVRLTHASHWHWTQVADHTATNLSVAYWQTSRAYALLGEAENARCYALLCLETSRDPEVDAFYLGYAYEALARAEWITGDSEAAEQHRSEAARIAASLSDVELRTALQADLATIEN